MNLKRKNLWNMSTLYIIMIIVMIAQTVISYFFHKGIFVVMLIFTVSVSTIAIYRMLNMQSYIKRMYNALNETLETSSNVFTKFTIPVMIASDNGEIAWYNDAFRLILPGAEDIFGDEIGSIIGEKERRSFAENNQAEMHLGGRIFTVFKSHLNYDGFNQYFYFFIDETELLQTAEEYKASRPVVAMISIDNLDEITKDAKDSEKATISGAIETVLENWAGESKGILRKLSSQRFMLIMEERSLESTVGGKFNVLDKVRSIDFGAKGSATLSVGVGHSRQSFQECETAAKLALEMAQGRGGDQAAVKDTGNNYRFFGGVSKAVERHTRVRARIVASAIRELIEGSDLILVMGHRYADLDCFGSSIAFWSLAKKMGKDAYVVMNRTQTMSGGLMEKAEDFFGEQVAYEEKDVLSKINRKTLLIVLDTHRPDFLDSRAVYEAAPTTVVIDHHRKAVDFIDNAVIFYHETAASSTAEMVSEMLQSIGEEYVGQMEADALLSGIMLDTKGFVLHTGVRTFEASAFLRRRGGDPVMVKQLFSGSLEAYRQKSDIISAAEVYKDCAISVCTENNEYTRIASSQAADELMNISGVNAGFVLFQTEKEINISARSFGNINVQLIMEQLGGGGHQTMAAAQIPGTDIAAAKQTLIGAIDDYKAAITSG